VGQAAGRPGGASLPKTMPRRIEVTVHPGAARPRVEERADGLHVWIAARPVEGAANEALLKAVAAHLGRSRGAVSLRLGGRSRRKLLEIAD
jgi:uncharacterized protein